MYNNKKKNNIISEFINKIKTFFFKKTKTKENSNLQRLLKMKTAFLVYEKKKRR